MGTTSQPEHSNRVELMLEMAHPDHAYTLAPSLREIDKFEIKASFPDNEIADSLCYGIETSSEAYSISTMDNKIHGLWGHGNWMGGPIQGDMGFVWMVTDDALFKHHAKHMTAVARKVIFPGLDTMYPAGYGNLVYAKNSVHLRWLSSCGFNAMGTWPVGPHPFTLMVRKSCAVR